MISFYFHLLLLHLNKGYKIEMCNVVLEAEQPSGSIYLLEANRATGSLYLKYRPFLASILNYFFHFLGTLLYKFYDGK